MGQYRYSTEQIVTKLRQAEVELSRGLPVPQVCKKLGISEQTYYRCWNSFRGKVNISSCTSGEPSISWRDRAPTTVNKTSGSTTVYQSEEEEPCINAPLQRRSLSAQHQLDGAEPRLSTTRAGMMMAAHATRHTPTARQVLA